MDSYLSKYLISLPFSATSMIPNTKSGWNTTQSWISTLQDSKQWTEEQNLPGQIFQNGGFWFSANFRIYGSQKVLDGKNSKMIMHYNMQTQNVFLLQQWCNRMPRYQIVEIIQLPIPGSLGGKSESQCPHITTCNFLQLVTAHL